MEYLLDTHTLLWSIGKSKELSDTARGILEASANEIFVSTVSLWEISLKYGLGKLVLGSIAPDDIPSCCDKLGFQIMPIGSLEASTYHNRGKTENHGTPLTKRLSISAFRGR